MRRRGEEEVRRGEHGRGKDRKDGEEEEKRKGAEDE